MKGKTNSYYAIIILFVITFTSCNCNKGKENETRKVFRYNESAGIYSLDPAFSKDQASIWACNQLYNGLVQLNEKAEVEPCIARSWTISDDGKTYTFRLRKNVFFHDHPLFKSGKGRRVVATDFEYSLNRIVDEKIASPGAWIFNNVAKDKNHYLFKAIDDSTFEIKLSNSFPPFLGLLTMQYCSVVPKEIVEHYGKEFRRNPIGTGPFRFKMWKEGVKLVMLKNNNYFEFDGKQQLPYLDAVSVTFIADKQSVFLEFVKGNLDFMSGIDASYKNELLTPSGKLSPKYKDKFNMVTQPYLNTEYLGFLVDEELPLFKNSPTRLKLIRRAINVGFDKVKMMKYMRNNIGVPATAGFIPQGMPGFDSSKVKGYSYNPQLSKQLLAEAGFPNGEGLPEITLSTTSSYLDLCKYIQQQLNEIGFKIKIDVNPPATLREMIAKSKLVFFRGSWIADYPDAENYLSLFYSKNFCPKGPNYTHFKNKDFDKLFEKAQAEVNDSIRFDYYGKMDQLIINEAAIVPLYYDQVLRFYQKNIVGTACNPMNLLTLKRIKKT